MQGYFRAYSNRVREASRELEERELRVYLALLSYANCRGMCWPGIAKLVDITGLCTDAVSSAIDGLVSKKYVQVVRKGTRDAFTRQMLPNVYNIDGAVIDDDCADDEYRTDDPILELSSSQESYHHHGTDSETKPEETKPEKTPSSSPDSFEVEVPKPKAKGKAKTPERSSIPQPPPSSAPPPRFYNGSLRDFAGVLPVDQEKLAMSIYVELQHKMPIRLARYLVATYGAAKVLWALAHLKRQSDVRNPAGFMRHLLEKDAIEQLDAAASNPGDRYINGEFSDYIDH